MRTPELVLATLDEAAGPLARLRAALEENPGRSRVNTREAGTASGATPGVPPANATEEAGNPINGTTQHRGGGAPASPNDVRLPDLHASGGVPAKPGVAADAAAPEHAQHWSETEAP